MENPYLTPPQVEGEQSRSWAAGFAYGFQGSALSSMTPADVQPEDAGAFDEGVLAGQDAAINGLELSQACIDLGVEPPTIPHLLTSGPEAGMAIYELGKHAWAGAFLSGVLFLVELSIGLETFSDDPDQALSQGANELQQRLQSLGFDAPLVLFVGGGIDLTVPGCELKLTSVFRSQEPAVEAAKALGRPQWLVASWRTDQSGGAKIVASS